MWEFASLNLLKEKKERAKNYCNMLCIMVENIREKLMFTKLKNYKIYKIYKIYLHTVAFLQTLLSDSLLAGTCNSQSVFLLKT
jgi:hypothetical protein